MITLLFIENFYDLICPHHEGAANIWQGKEEEQHCLPVESSPIGLWGSLLLFILSSRRKYADAWEHYPCPNEKVDECGRIPRMHVCNDHANEYLRYESKTERDGTQTQGRLRTEPFVDEIEPEESRGHDARERIEVREIFMRRNQRVRRTWYVCEVIGKHNGKRERYHHKNRGEDRRPRLHARIKECGGDTGCKYHRGVEQDVRSPVGDGEYLDAHAPHNEKDVWENVDNPERTEREKIPLELSEHYTLLACRGARTLARTINTIGYETRK